MSNRRNDALGSLVTAGASFWALYSCRDLKFASVGFLMYAVVGLLGVLEYAMTSSETVRKIYNHASTWSRPLYLPLLSIDALLVAGLQLHYAAALLVFPLFYLFMTELLHKHVRGDLLDLSTVVCALAVCYAAYSAQDIVGGVLALLGLAAFMGTSKFRNSLEHLLMVAVLDVAAVQFFKHLFF